jgi:hypothetical protein
VVALVAQEIHCSVPALPPKFFTKQHAKMLLVQIRPTTSQKTVSIAQRNVKSAILPQFVLNALQVLYFTMPSAFRLAHLKVTSIMGTRCASRVSHRAKSVRLWTTAPNAIYHRQ